MRTSGVRLDLLNGSYLDFEPLVPSAGEPATLGLSVVDTEGKSVVLMLTDDHVELIEDMLAHFRRG